MNTVMRTISAAVALQATLALAGCSQQSILSALGTGQHIPANGVLLSPNEKVTLNARTAKQWEYFCSNGAVVQCERLGAKLYCSCPRR